MSTNPPVKFGLREERGTNLWFVMAVRQDNSIYPVLRPLPREEAEDALDKIEKGGHAIP